MVWKIQNLETKEIVTLHRDVCQNHPDWIHDQLGTVSEYELQMVLDQYNETDFYDGENFKGPDCYGVFPQ